MPVRLPGDTPRGVFVAAVLTGPQQAAIDRVLRWQLAAGAVALLLGLVLAWLTAGRVLDAAQTPPTTNSPTMMYCGMASRHHFTRTSPRDSRSG